VVNKQTPRRGLSKNNSLEACVASPAVVSAHEYAAVAPALPLWPYSASGELLIAVANWGVGKTD